MGAFDPVQAMPTGATEGARYARELARLIGPALAPADNTSAGDDLLSLGDALAEINATLDRAIDQHFPESATDLLEEQETRMGIPVDPGAPEADRQAALLAANRAGTGGTPDRILSVAKAFDSTAAKHEASAALVAATDPRAVNRLVLTVSAATWTANRDRIVRLLQRTIPVHMEVVVAVTASFKCDSPDSLCDRDVLAL